MKTPEEMRNTPIDVYVINGVQYLKRDDVKLLLQGEDVPITSTQQSDTRFDIPVNITFK
jgi:hypothetical protein